MQQYGHNFYIASLPRSRSAWLANLFTTGDSFCYHEILGRKGGLPKRAEKYVGSTETCIHLIPENEKTLIVHRDVEDCILSLNNSFDIPSDAVPFLEESMRNNAVLLRDIKGLHISFNDIENNIERIWSYLLPSIPLDVDRVEEMMRMNVQIHTTDIMEVF